MWPILVLAGVVGVYFWNQSSQGASVQSSGSDDSHPSSGVTGYYGPLAPGSNPWNLPDIDSSNQSGNFKTDFDSSFEKASGSTQVPFALIKAHAIRESSLNAQAYHYDNAQSGASYGLMQVEWISGSNRFAQFGAGFTADEIRDGSILYDPDTNAFLGASVIQQNLQRFKGNLRDAINAYNTGAAESVRQAPANYVNDVINYYSQIIGAPINV